MLLQEVEETKAVEMGWSLPPGEPELGIEALVDWRNAVKSLRVYAVSASKRKAEIAREFGIAPSSLSEWYNGNYRGSYPPITEKVRNGLRFAEDQREASVMLKEPDFLLLPTARKVMDALMFAQTAPTISVITLGPGMGKTSCANHYVATRPNAYRVVMRPSTQSPFHMLREIAAELGISGIHTTALARSIGQKLKRNGRNTLLMVDEAQHLTDQAVNELRYLMDEFGTGIALLGNLDVHAKFGGQAPKEGYGQLHSRIGLRLRQLKPKQQDIDAYVAAWGFTDPETVKLLRAIGVKSGALRQVRGTIQIAAIAALGRGDTVTAADIRQAWINRAGEELC